MKPLVLNLSAPTTLFFVSYCADSYMEPYHRDVSEYKNGPNINLPVCTLLWLGFCVRNVFAGGSGNRKNQECEGKQGDRTRERKHWTPSPRSHYPVVQHKASIVSDSLLVWLSFVLPLLVVCAVPNTSSGSCKRTVSVNIAGFLHLISPIIVQVCLSRKGYAELARAITALVEALAMSTLLTVNPNPKPHI